MTPYLSSFRPLLNRVFAASLLVMLSAGGNLRAEDPSIIALAKTYLDRALKSVSDRFGAEEESTPQAKSPDEIARTAALRGHLRSIFLEEKGYHFTQSKWGGKPKPYQIDGLEVRELPSSNVNDSDHNAGIDRRITYSLEAKAFRTYDGTKGWGSWEKGEPPHFDSVTLVRQEGSWKVSISPAWAYSHR